MGFFSLLTICMRALSAISPLRHRRCQWRLQPRRRLAICSSSRRRHRRPIRRRHRVLQPNFCSNATLVGIIRAHSPVSMRKYLLTVSEQPASMQISSLFFVLFSVASSRGASVSECLNPAAFYASPILNTLLSCQRGSPRRSRQTSHNSFDSSPLAPSTFGSADLNSAQSGQKLTNATRL